MRKKIFGVALMAAIAITAGWNMSQSKTEISVSEIALDNVEALASGEESKYEYVISGGDSSVHCVCSKSGNNSCC